ncbi:MAG: hypothetical protein QMB20_00645, partial [Flavobacteriales bacterium]
NVRRKEYSFKSSFMDIFDFPDVPKGLKSPSLDFLGLETLSSVFMLARTLFKRGIDFSGMYWLIFRIIVIRAAFS